MLVLLFLEQGFFFLSKQPPNVLTEKKRKQQEQTVTKAFFLGGGSQQLSLIGLSADVLSVQNYRKRAPLILHFKHNLGFFLRH